MRAVVEQHTGRVAEASNVTNGQSSDVAAVLRTAGGKRVFLKGVRGVGPRMRWLRNEIVAADLAKGIAPAVLFHADVGEWLVVGFEYVAGRAADIGPGSPDLPLVAATVAGISGCTATGLRPLEDRWNETDWWTRLPSDIVDGWKVVEMSRRAACLPELVRGDRLVHTDLHGEQFRIGDGGVHVIDWGLPGAGAPWVDRAFLVLRLIEAGHDPGDAERWAEVDGPALDAFSAYIAGLWSWWAVRDKTDAGAEHRARLARGYAARRHGCTH